MSQLSTSTKNTTGARRSKTMATDAQMVNFLYAILKQLDLKSIDWNLVASQLEISNGHAARMRYSRFRQQMEGNVSASRTPKPKKSAAGASATGAKGDKCGGRCATKSTNKCMEAPKKRPAPGEWPASARKASPGPHESPHFVKSMLKSETDTRFAFRSSSAPVALPPPLSAPTIASTIASPGGFMDTCQSARSAGTSPFQFDTSPFATICPADLSVFQSPQSVLPSPSSFQPPYPNQHPAPVVQFPGSASYTPSFAPAPQPTQTGYRWAPVKPEPGESGAMDDLLVKIEPGVTV